MGKGVMPNMDIVVAAIDDAMAIAATRHIHQRNGLAKGTLALLPWNHLLQFVPKKDLSPKLQGPCTKRPFARSDFRVRRFRNDLAIFVRSSSA